MKRLAIDIINETQDLKHLNDYIENIKFVYSKFNDLQVDDGMFTSDQVFLLADEVDYLGAVDEYMNKIEYWFSIYYNCNETRIYAKHCNYELCNATCNELIIHNYHYELLMYKNKIELCKLIEKSILNIIQKSHKLTINKNSYNYDYFMKALMLL